MSNQSKDCKKSEVITLSVELTQGEADYLTSELNMILREFDTVPYNGKMFTNPEMASAFNKVFKAIVGRDHENCTPERMERMKEIHEGSKR